MTDVKDLSFEKALQELEGIVSKMEQGNMTLEEAVQSYERGAQLRRQCDALLKNATLRIEKITLGRDGAVQIEAPRDVD